MRPMKPVQLKKKSNVKPYLVTSIFWIVVAGLIIGFMAYGNAKYVSGMNAGFDKAQSLLQAK